ncbi:hypothetical protein BB561_003872 [Smittium simulii]|uniref:Amino acid transporter transmembrane domain-containing protein n=1 Tax=Smittium simulii TaxID=133385 RepID=A0A2T9YJ48_9FUNG|nr:hypothetical protein BB561_003872 [Smittium simulii]
MEISTTQHTNYGAIDEHTSLIQENKQLASNYDTFLSICCIIMGTGILQLPSTLKEGGWVGLVYIILAGILSNYTGILTVKCLYTEHGERLGTLADSGRAAFGDIGYTLTNEFKKYSLLAAGAIFILLAGINFNSLAVTLFDLQPNLTLCLKKRLGSDFEYPPTTIIRIFGFPVSFSSICFAFGGNLLWPEIEMGMKYPKSFNAVLSASNAAVTILYLLVAASAYSVFGNNVTSPVLLDFTASFVLTLAYLFITAHVVLTAPLLLIGAANDWAKDLSNKFYPDGGWSTLHRNILRLLMVAFSVATVLVVPNFEKLVAFFSSLTSALLIFVIPAVFYIKIYRSRINFGILDYAWLYFIIFVGAFCFIFGSYLSGIDLIYG